MCLLQDLIVNSLRLADHKTWSEVQREHNVQSGSYVFLTDKLPARASPRRNEEEIERRAMDRSLEEKTDTPERNFCSIELLGLCAVC